MRKLVLLSVAVFVGVLLSAFAIERSYVPQNTSVIPAMTSAQLVSTADEVLFQSGVFTRTVFLPLVTHTCRSEPMPMGVQIYFDISNTSSIQFQRLVESTALWVRKPIYWRQVEPNNTTPDNYNWSTYDTQYLNANQNGLKIIATIIKPPDWARDESHINITHISDFVEFVTAIVERYDGDGIDDAAGSPVVKYWEFFNEPDGDWGHYGAEYANMLSQVYPAVKQANPQAVVLMGGLAFDWFEEDGGPFNRYFINDVLTAGGGNYFDMMNFHYYPPFMYWQQWGPGLIGKNNYLKAELAKYGVEKPVVVTETGWDWLSWDGNQDFAGVPGASGEEMQNRFVVQTYSQAMAADIKIANWFVFNDISPWFYGFTDPNFDKRPSFNVFQTVVNQLQQANYARTLNASELGYGDAEGYAFTRCQTQIHVAWTNDGSTAQMKIHTNAVNVVDMYGNKTYITDASDGNHDGITNVAYNAPTYILF